MIGRYSELNNIKEVDNLEVGMDFRKPEYRREVLALVQWDFTRIYKDIVYHLNLFRQRIEIWQCFGI